MSIDKLLTTNTNMHNDRAFIIDPIPRHNINQEISPLGSPLRRDTSKNVILPHHFNTDLVDMSSVRSRHSSRSHSGTEIKPQGYNLSVLDQGRIYRRLRFPNSDSEKDIAESRQKKRPREVNFFEDKDSSSPLISSFSPKKMYQPQEQDSAQGQAPETTRIPNLSRLKVSVQAC